MIFIDNHEILKQYKDEILCYDRVAVDLETTGLDYNAVVVGACIVGEKEFYFPLNHYVFDCFDEKLFYSFIQELFLYVPEIWFHNAKYDLRYFIRAGIDIDDSKVRDTQLLAYLLGFSDLKLKHISEDLGYDSPEFKEVVGDNDILGVNPYLVGAYCINDGFITLKLADHLVPRLTKIKGYKQFLHVECPLTVVLAEMEAEGFLVDIDFLTEYNKELTATLKDVDNIIFKMLGKEINLNSSIQLYKVIYEELSLFPRKYLTFTDHPTDPKPQMDTQLFKKILKFGRGKGKELAELLLQHSKLSKIISTYTEGLVKEANKYDDKRIRGHFNQTVAATYRLSSSSPNLQNIPKRSDEGKLIRKAFISNENNVLIDCDLSQIEMRIMAHFSKDPNMLAIFSSGKDKDGNDCSDVHLKTQLEIESIKKQSILRVIAKMTNFGCLYGAGWRRLVEMLLISKKEAEILHTGFHNAYTRIKPFIKECESFANRKGFMDNILGTRRYFNKDLKSLYSVAVNTKVQSSAAIFLKIAMIDFYRARKIVGGEKECKIISQVHDEVILESTKERAEFYKNLLAMCMENAMVLSVPVLADSQTATNWGDAH